MTTRRRMRWRMMARESITGAEMHGLYMGDERLAAVQAHKTCDGYFWYGGGKNTSHEPPQALGEAKLAAAAHVRAQRAKS